MPIIKANKIQMKNSIHITKHLITLTFCQLLTHAHFANLIIYQADNIHLEDWKTKKLKNLRVLAEVLQINLFEPMLKIQVHQKKCPKLLSSIWTDFQM